MKINIDYSSVPQLEDNNNLILLTLVTSIVVTAVTGYLFYKIRE